MKKFLIYWAGKYSKTFRLYYYKKHDDYHWGLVRWILDGIPFKFVGAHEYVNCSQYNIRNLFKQFK